MGWSGVESIEPEGRNKRSRLAADARRANEQTSFWNVQQCDLVANDRTEKRKNGN